MASTNSAYPLTLKTFTQKRNLLDDVEAAHINEIQNEILGLEQTVGINPTYDKASNRRFNSVAQRMDWMTSRESTPAFYLGRSDSFYVTASPPPHAGGTSMGTTDLTIVPFPHAGSDDSGLWDGTGIQIKESGFYYLGAQLSFAATTTLNSPASRTLGLNIWYGNNRSIINGSASTINPEVTMSKYQTIHLNTSMVYPLYKGHHVDVRVGMNTGTGGPYYRASTFNGALFGFKIRDVTSPLGTWPAAGA